jgi:hypothetical protein
MDVRNIDHHPPDTAFNPAFNLHQAFLSFFPDSAWKAPFPIAYGEQF